MHKVRSALTWLAVTDYERRVAALYEGMAGSYLERITPRQSYWPRVAALLSGVRAGTLLDVGCGPGHLTAALPPEVAVYGLDLARAMIDAASAARPAGTYAIGSFDEPLPAGWPRFDCIVVAGCLEFSAELDRVLVRLAAALAPGGRIVATIPEERGSGARRSTRIIRGAGESVPVSLYSFLAAAEAIAGAGLAPETYAYIPAWIDADGVPFHYGLWTLRENSAARSGAAESARASSATSSGSTSS